MGCCSAFSYTAQTPAISQCAANATNEGIRFLSSSAFLQSLSPQDRARLESLQTYVPQKVCCTR